MLVYVITAFGTLWGILTLISIREEDKEIEELLESARNHLKNSQLPDQDLED